MAKSSDPKLRDLRTRLIVWLNDQVPVGGVVDLDALGRAAVGHFAGDRDFAIAWFRATVRQAVETHCRWLARTDPSLARQGDKLVPRPILRATLETLPAAWEGFVEFDPTAERAVPILEMTREDLLTAAASHREAGHDEYVRAGLLERLAEPLKPRERVRDRWTWDDVEQLESRLQATIRTGLVERVDVRGDVDGNGHGDGVPAGRGHLG